MKSRIRKIGAWGGIAVAAAGFALSVGPGRVTASDPLWDLNDFSILLPLPERIGSPGQLTPSSAGAQGMLFPQEILRRMPPLVVVEDAEELRARLRVVAVRLDPCFAETDPARAPNCRAQIRMVWQPLLERSEAHTSGPVRVETEDAAFHTFYELGAGEFAELAGAARELRRRERGGALVGQPLQIHPLISRQGLSGPYWTALRAMILRLAGEHRLSRITFMTLRGGANQWQFGGFDRSLESPGAPLKKIRIARIHQELQTFTNETFPFTGFLGGLLPEPRGMPDLLNVLVTDSRRVRPEDTVRLRPAIEALHRIENPRVHTPESVDCVSCHVAQPARVWVTRNLPGLRPEEGAGRFRSRLDLTNLSTGFEFTDSVRAFGYKGREPAISQRVIHETAAVVESLSSTP